MKLTSKLFLLISLSLSCSAAFANGSDRCTSADTSNKGLKLFGEVTTETEGAPSRLFTFCWLGNWSNPSPYIALMSLANQPDQVLATYDSFEVITHKDAADSLSKTINLIGYLQGKDKTIEDSIVLSGSISGENPSSAITVYYIEKELTQRKQCQAKGIWQALADKIAGEQN